jgi:hypothetical protein
MIGTSGLLTIDTGDGYTTGFETQTFGRNERASGGGGGTFQIEDMMHGYTDRRDRFAGDSGRYQVGAYQAGRGSSGRTRNIDSPAMDTDIINISTSSRTPLRRRKLPLQIRRNKITSTISNMLGGVKDMFKGRKLLRRTRL